MNGSFYENPTYPNSEPLKGKIFAEEETSNRHFNSDNNLFELNKGKKAKIYTSFPFSSEWKDKMFTGIIEGSKNDSLIISDGNTGEWCIIPINYIDFISFEEKINLI